MTTLHTTNEAMYLAAKIKDMGLMVAPKTNSLLGALVHEAVITGDYDGPVSADGPKYNPHGLQTNLNANSTYQNTLNEFGKMVVPMFNDHLFVFKNVIKPELDEFVAEVTKRISDVRPISAEENVLILRYTLPNILTNKTFSDKLKADSALKYNKGRPNGHGNYVDAYLNVSTKESLIEFLVASHPEHEDDIKALIENLPDFVLTKYLATTCGKCYVDYDQAGGFYVTTPLAYMIDLETINYLTVTASPTLLRDYFREGVSISYFEANQQPRIEETAYVLAKAIAGMDMLVSGGDVVLSINVLDNTGVGKGAIVVDNGNYAHWLENGGVHTTLFGLAVRSGGERAGADLLNPEVVEKYRKAWDSYKATMAVIGNEKYVSDFKQIVQHAFTNRYATNKTDIELAVAKDTSRFCQDIETTVVEYVSKMKVNQFNLDEITLVAIDLIAGIRFAFTNAHTFFKTMYVMAKREPSLTPEQLAYTAACDLVVKYVMGQTTVTKTGT